MTATLRGADISFKGNAAAMKAAGLAFAIAECSIGMHDNPTGAVNLAEFKKASLLAGLYHYCIFTNDPAAEADALVSRVKRFEQQAGGKCDVALAIDIEQPRSASDQNLPLPPQQIITWLDVFIPRVSKGVGVTLFAYTYPAYLKMLDVPELATSALKDCLLWLADYGHGLFPDSGAIGLVFQPTSSFFVRNNPWSKWTMMQTKGDANIPGVPHIVDVDAFAGSVSDLMATGNPPSILPVVEPASGLPPVVAGPVTSVVTGRAGFLATLLAAIAAAGWWAWRRLGRR